MGKETKLPKGRPPIYSDALADAICDVIATSTKGLHSICKENDSFPSIQTIFNWLQSEKYFIERYARAREVQAELLADEIISISDDTTNDDLIDDEGRVRPNSEWINRSRLRVDARKWKASKLAPKKYGDKLDVTTDGEKISQVFKIGYSKPNDEESE